MPEKENDVLKETQQEDLPAAIEETSAAEVQDAEIDALRKASEAERKRTYKPGSKVAAFIFFFITVAIFAIYEYLAVTFLYMPFIHSINDLGEAIAAIFGYTFGLVFTMIFGAAQLPGNIIAIILFSRIRGRSDKKWENTLFTVFFALSIVMLILMILTIGLFFIIIGTNK